MAITVKLDDLLHDRRITLTELADKVDITHATLSHLKTGPARAIRVTPLQAICAAPACQPAAIKMVQHDRGRHRGFKHARPVGYGKNHRHATHTKVAVKVAR